MQYVTQENTCHPGFVMPVAISATLEVPPAGSGYYAILFWREGSLILEDSNSRYLFHGPGVLCVTPEHVIRSVSFNFGGEPTEGVRTLVFKPEGLNTNYESFPDTFEYRALTGIDTGYSYRYLAEPVTVRLESLCQAINQQMNVEQGTFWPCLSRSYILELLLLIERTRYSAETISEYSLPQCSEQIRKVFEYIHASYREDMTLNSLAERFGTNRTTLNRLFKESCGMTVMAYLGKIRMTVAALLLQNTTLTVQDIAWRIGLNDDAYFSRLFRHKTGVSPSEFRRKVPHPYGHAWSAEES